MLPFIDILLSKKRIVYTDIKTSENVDDTKREDSLDRDDSSLDCLLESKQKSPATKWRVSLIIALLFTMFLSGFITSSAIRLLKAHTPIDKRFEWTSCGHDPDTALSRNCKFEPMLGSWIPEACFMSEFSASHNPLIDLTWYHDINLTQPILGKDLEDMRAGRFSIIYSDNIFHDIHCTYVWNKLAIATEERHPLVDGLTAMFHHSNHCADRFNEMAWAAVGRNEPFEHAPWSSLTLGFQPCRKMFHAE